MTNFPGLSGFESGVDEATRRALFNVDRRIEALELASVKTSWLLHNSISATVDVWYQALDEVGYQGNLLLLVQVAGNDGPSGAWVCLKNSVYDTSTITVLAQRDGFWQANPRPALEVMWGYGLNNLNVRVTGTDEDIEIRAFLFGA